MTKFFDRATETYDNMADVVEYSFDWETTEEGHEYWHDVYKALRDIEHDEGEYGLVEGETLNDAFVWDNTKQGHCYWAEVYAKLNALKKEYLDSKETEGEEVALSEKAAGEMVISEEIASPYEDGKTCADYGLTVGDRFMFVYNHPHKYCYGDILTLVLDDGSPCPRFKRQFDGLEGFCHLDRVAPIEDKTLYDVGAWPEYHIEAIKKPLTQEERIENILSSFTLERKL